MSLGVPIGLEMESRYASSYAWQCPECGAFTNISKTNCKRCKYKRKRKKLKENRGG